MIKCKNGNWIHTIHVICVRKVGEVVMLYTTDGLSWPTEWPLIKVRAIMMGVATEDLVCSKCGKEVDCDDND